jgi:hypothetical protein
MNSGPVLGEIANSVQGIPHLLMCSTLSLVLFLVNLPNKSWNERSAAVLLKLGKI